jgi:hypothetical protein
MRTWQPVAQFCLAHHVDILLRKPIRYQKQLTSNTYFTGSAATTADATLKDGSFFIRQRQTFASNEAIL